MKKYLLEFTSSANPKAYDFERVHASSLDRLRRDLAELVRRFRPLYKDFDRFAIYEAAGDCYEKTSPEPIEAGSLAKLAEAPIL
jgi:hypothetical protein